MRKNHIISTVIIALLVSFQVFSQVDVIFKVTMSTETVSADGIHIVGSVNGWDTSINQLTQEGTTDIYSTTIQLNTGWYEYKFLNGNAWGTEETAIEPCALLNGNRFLYINDSGVNVTLEAVPFNGCNAESTGLSVIFNVDMSSELTVSENGVHIVGSLNGWSTDNLEVANNSGDIHSTTLRLPTPADYPIIFEYKYLNGNAWGTEETPDSECTTVVETNRLITVPNSGTIVNDIFNGCVTLGIADFNGLETLQVFYTKDRGLVIDSSNSFSKTLDIQVFDFSGKSVFQEKLSNLNGEPVEIKLKSLNTGLYIARITNEHQQTKFVKFISN